MNAPGIAPIPLTRKQIELIQEWAPKDRLWGSKAATETNLYTFARLILKYADDETRETCEGGVTVRWCPRCGTCNCPEQNGNPDRWVDDPACPIHGHRSKHAEPTRSVEHEAGLELARKLNKAEDQRDVLLEALRGFVDDECACHEPDAHVPCVQCVARAAIAEAVGR